MAAGKTSVLDWNDDPDDQYWTFLYHRVLIQASREGSTQRVLSLVKRVRELDERDQNGETTLHKASLFLPLEIIRCLVEQGADINLKTSMGATPLLYAAISKRRDVFDLLLDAGANVDGCCEDKHTVLHYAIESGWIDIVPSLVKRLPDLEATDKNGDTALHNAAIFYPVEIVKCLIEEGANINAKGHKGSTPLLYAAEHSRKDVFNLLLCAGANVDVCDDDKRSVLHHASENGSAWTEIVQFLVKRIQDFDARDNRGKSALHMAAFYECLEITKFLVEGADMNARSETGATPLLYAAAKSHRDVFNLLLYAGTNVDFCDHFNYTVLHYALEFSWMEEARTLVKRVHDLETRDLGGETALHKESRFGRLEGVMCLVEGRADINGKTSTGVTPLLYAAMNAHRDIFDLLLDAGANVDGCCEDKQTVLHYALRNEWLDIVPPLVKRITDINKSDKYDEMDLHNASIGINARNMCDETALFEACRIQNLDMVECLFQANARPDITNVYGKSPLHYLIITERPCVKLVKLFIENAAVLSPADYDSILESSLLKVEILQDIKFCCRVIVSKYNNYDLPKLYKLPVAGGLPCIEKIKIQSRSEVFQAIQRTVRFEIETEGHCTQLKRHPMALKVLCVKSVLEYYDKKKIG